MHSDYFSRKTENQLIETGLPVALDVFAIVFGCSYLVF